MQDNTNRRNFLGGLTGLLGGGLIIDALPAKAKTTDPGETAPETPGRKSLGDIFNEYPFKKEYTKPSYYPRIVTDMGKDIAGVVVALLDHQLADSNIRYIDKPSRFAQNYIRTTIDISDQELYTEDFRLLKYRIIDASVSLATMIKSYGDIICNRGNESNDMEWSATAHTDKASILVVRGYDIHSNAKLTYFMIPFVNNEADTDELSDEEINRRIRERMHKSNRWPDYDLKIGRQINKSTIDIKRSLV